MAVDAQCLVHTPMKCKCFSESDSLWREYMCARFEWTESFHLKKCRYSKGIVMEAAKPRPAISRF